MGTIRGSLCDREHLQMLSSGNKIGEVRFNGADYNVVPNEDVRKTCIPNYGVT